MTPDVRVVRGAPDDDELAALVAGLVAGSALAGHEPGRAGADAAADAAIEHGRRRWRDAAERRADPLAPGPDVWRWSTSR